MSFMTDIAPILIRTAGSIAYEKLRRPRPTAIEEVPPSPEALTTTWLTAALCADVPGAEVIEFDLGPKDNGTSSRRTINVGYNTLGEQAGLPKHLFSKSSPTLLTRLVTSTGNLLPAEHAFYSDIWRRVELETPTPRYAAWDPRTNRSLFLMDDVTVTRSARLDTILTRTTTKIQAEDMIRALASLHAPFWDDGSLTQRYKWLMTPSDWQRRINKLMSMDKNAIVGFERAKHVIPSRIFARRDDFLEALMRSRAVSTTGPRTLIHSDVHAGNWYVTGDDRMGLFDWQCMLNGLGMQDVTYGLVANLTVENRREWERDLVMQYGKELANRGVEQVPDSNELWLRYRQMVPHAMFMWLGTIGANRLQPEMQKPEISLANLARSAQACQDLETFAALGL